MSDVGRNERPAQNDIVKLFRTPEAKGGLGYTYLGFWYHEKRYSPIEPKLLRDFLTRKQYTPGIIDRAIAELTKVAANLSKGLYYANKDVYDLLRYGIKVREDIGEHFQTVWLIDWDKSNPNANDFAIAEEVTINTGAGTKRPDIVLYVNGIALGVIELKSSRVSVATGIRQNWDSQQPQFIESFFSTMQLVMAGSDSEGLRYGTIQTTEKYYLTWHPDGDMPPPPGTPDKPRPLAQDIAEICQKGRFLELIHDFVAYDRGTKKLCRSHQFYGVRAAQERTRRREGGIIWHTQGSGKSLTMVWLANWILENITGSRVVIITDRDELDKQIENVFMGVGRPIRRTLNGADLLTQLNAETPSLLCSLIHKFGGKEHTHSIATPTDYDAYLAELKNAIPADYKAKGDIYVMVDECHRTQSGTLHDAMKALLPNALFIGFTGTPLLKKDKDTSLKVFGSFIHTYKFNQAVYHKVVLDLRYEARDIDQELTSPGRVDQYFEAKTQGMTDIAKIELKKRWGTLRKLYSSKSRLEKISADIILDMSTRPYLKSGAGNALLVSDSIYNACKYYELFEASELAGKCAIVTSYRPSINDTKGESTEGQTEKLRKHAIYTKMLNGKEPEVFEDEAKEKFIRHPGQMKLLIVVDKLLTGFDAPSATYLYIDKHMQDHGLFQAICRVNRLDGETKDYGYIVDYMNLFGSVSQSMQNYTTDALGDYDPKDVEGLLGDRVAKGREHVKEMLEIVRALCEPVAEPKNTDDYRHYFNGDDATNEERTRRRALLYRSVSALLRAYADIANDLEEAGYTAAEASQLKKDVAHYEAVRLEIKLSSGDSPDLKQYEPAMRHLLDQYIRAEDSRILTSFDDLSLVELLAREGLKALDALPDSIRTNREAVAETIENNVRRLIINTQETNAVYFGKMSELLEALIQRRKEEAITYEEYLNSVADIARQVVNPNADQYPPTVKTPGQRAFYDNLDKNESLTLALDEVVHYSAKNGWPDHPIKEKEIEREVKKLLEKRGETEPEAKAKAKYVVSLAKKQKEYRK